MIRYQTFGGLHLVNDDEGPIVLHTDAVAEIDRRDEQIADLKALLYRAAGVIEHSVVDTYFHDNHDVTKLQGEIEKALV